MVDFPAIFQLITFSGKPGGFSRVRPLLTKNRINMDKQTIYLDDIYDITISMIQMI